MKSQPALVICMGVSGSGKSTLGKNLASRFGLTFIDADDYHCDSNVRTMRAGQPLTDEDREPWMERVCSALDDLLRSGRDGVLAHSALRQVHRDRMRRIGFRTVFLHLRGDRDELARRLRARRDHYMPADLLNSQFDALEPTQRETDVLNLDVSDDPAAVLASASLLLDDILLGEHIDD